MEKESEWIPITFRERRAMWSGRTIDEIGEAQGLREGIALCLELKFGEAGRVPLPWVLEIGDPAELRAILQRMKTAPTLAEVLAEPERKG
jgi:hypothetical protein